MVLFEFTFSLRSSSFVKVSFVLCISVSIIVIYDVPVPGPNKALHISLYIIVSRVVGCSSTGVVVQS